MTDPSVPTTSCIEAGGRHMSEPRTPRPLGRLLGSVYVLSVIVCSIASAEQPPPSPEVMEIVQKVQQAYAAHCCFRATFDQLTVNVAMDLKDRFRGTMYVKKPNRIALDVVWPEKQTVVLVGRSYSVYFHTDGNAVRGECPPEIDVEHFFGFFANIGALDRNFSIQFPSRPQDELENLTFLELRDQKSPQSTYRIILGIDMKQHAIRRAVIYDALGNYNRFDLSDTVFLETIPDSRFSAAPSPAELLTSPEKEK